MPHLRTLSTLAGAKTGSVGVRRRSASSMPGPADEQVAVARGPVRFLRRRPFGLEHRPGPGQRLQEPLPVPTRNQRLVIGGTAPVGGADRKRRPPATEACMPHPFPGHRGRVEPNGNRSHRPLEALARQWAPKTLRTRPTEDPSTDGQVYGPVP